MSVFMVVTLLIERESCRSNLGWVWEMLVFGIGAGFFGSLVRSPTGAWHRNVAEPV